MVEIVLWVMAPVLAFARKHGGAGLEKIFDIV